MKRTIRRGVFETNSSSTHSVTIREDIPSPALKVEDDNKVHAEFDEFGWEWEHYFTAKSKLSYALTMVVETECKRREDNTIPNFFETEGFKAINDLIKEKCKCDGVTVDSEIKVVRHMREDGEYTYIDHDGYIDHQSCEDYNSLQDFLDTYGVTLEQFIFDEHVILNTGNDNDGPDVDY